MNRRPRQRFTTYDVKKILEGNTKYFPHGAASKFFPGDVYPHNRSFSRWCQRKAEEGVLVRYGDAGDRWGYQYEFPKPSTPPHA